jgi:MerR family transcriptional regulator, copper efflux regulator
MKIGELAAQTEVNVQTIRFYEREGLLRKPERTLNGYRTYQREDSERVRFIKICQGLGFTLREVRQLIQLHGVAMSSNKRPAMSAQSAQKIIAIAQDRLATIEEKMQELARMQAEMQRVIRSLSSTASPRCPAGAPGSSGVRER